LKAQSREIRRYVTGNGTVPFAEWFESLKDLKTQAKIISRLNRVAAGNLGDYRSVGGGVFEIRIHYGAGFRIYFSQIGMTIVLLLCGGDKSTQGQDILKAKEYWKDYANRESANE
jgi:putative addiction module killer protein